MPARFSRIMKRCEELGLSCEKPRSGGSHWKIRRPGFRVYPVPAHNGRRTEIDDRIIGKLCKHFELDEDSFRDGL